MDQSEGNKSEQATPFKLRKARERGQVAKGTDLGFVAALAAALAYFWVQGDSFFRTFAQSIGRLLAASGQILPSQSNLLQLVGAGFVGMLALLLVFAVILFAIVLLVEFLQTGPVFSTQVLKPDFNRINPAQGFKRIFSVKALQEMVKSILKFLAYGCVGWLFLRWSFHDIAAHSTDARTLAPMMARLVFTLLFYCVAVAFCFMILDQMMARRFFAKQMRMSSRDIKREHRDHEGEPRLKSKRKQLHAEFLKLAQSLRDVRGADIVIVNPDHYAVALLYDPKTMDAPQIVARGRNHFALRIKRTAATFQVLVIERAPLARALYAQGHLKSPIPEGLYQQVADLYVEYGIRDRKQGSKGE